MPLPTPNSGESRDDFLQRCMKNPTMNSEYPDNEQRYAVCNTQWRKKEMKSLLKSFDYQVKDIDEPKGIVVFYANSFNKKDSDNDIIVKGAFKKTLSENIKRIKHLLDHQVSIGVPLSIKEDDFGLLTESQLIMKKQAGKEAFEEYKVYADLQKSMEHSIRLDVIKYDTDKESETRTIKEAKLWDVSTITRWGANEWTPQIELKNGEFFFPNIYGSGHTLQEEIKILEAMLKGRFSDERLIQIENTLNTLKSLINGEPQYSTYDDEPIQYLRSRLNFMSDGRKTKEGN